MPHILTTFGPECQIGALTLCSCAYVHAHLHECALANLPKRVRSDTKTYLCRFICRSSGQFPSKFAALPGIGARESPEPNANNQVMPYSARGAVDEGDDRVRQIETRLNVAEKSNRALLDEVVRLQGELKFAVRKNEENIREEKQARQQMESVLRTSRDTIEQLGSRLRRAEERTVEDKASIQALLNHTKSVEQTVLNGQQELLTRKDLHTTQ